MKLELKHWSVYAPYKPLIYGSSDLFTLYGAVQYKDMIQLFADHPIYGRIEMDACEYSLVLKLAEDLTKEDWMDIFKAGLKDYPEVLDASVEYKIHKNSEIVRLYNPDYGFSCVVPKSTVVSFSLPTLQFSSVFKFNQISAFNELCKKRVDLYGLIENNLAIDIKTL